MARPHYSISNLFQEKQSRNDGLKCVKSNLRIFAKKLQFGFWITFLMCAWDLLYLCQTYSGRYLVKTLNYLAYVNDVFLYDCANNRTQRGLFNRNPLEVKRRDSSMWVRHYCWRYAEVSLKSAGQGNDQRNLARLKACWRCWAIIWIAGPFQRLTATDPGQQRFFWQLNRSEFDKFRRSKNMGRLQTLLLKAGVVIINVLVKPLEKHLP